MLGREHHKSDAPKRVGTGGEDFNRVAGFGVEDDVGAFGFADPFALQGFDMLGPVQLAVVEQFFGVSGCSEEPLLEIFADDGRVAAFAVAVVADDLFARQGGVAAGGKNRRAPVFDRQNRSLKTAGTTIESICNIRDQR